QAPEFLPALHPGAPLTIALRYRNPNGTTPIAAVTGQRPDGSRWRASAAATVAAPAARALWAKSRLRDLEDRYAAHAFDIDLDSLIHEIVATSVRHRVLSRFTAFVAVDVTTSDVAAGTPLTTVAQPAELVDGWDMRVSPVDTCAMSPGASMRRSRWTAGFGGD